MEFNQSITLLIAGLYYVVAGFFLFFSLFTVYVLLRYGRSRTISLVTATVYSVFFLSVLSLSLASLQALTRGLNA
jgi:hypothetical protein